MLANAWTALLVGGAVVMAALVVRQRTWHAPEPRSFREVGPIPALEAGGSLIGPEDAPLRIVEFSDFQCPSCAASQPGLRAILARYPEEVAISYRHLPLPEIHPYAVAAALAAECAREQGRFREFHDALFAAQDSIGTTSWSVFARRAGVRDADGFDRCLGQRRHAGRLAADGALADDLGLSATPAFVFRGRLLVGAEAPGVLADWVEAAVSEMRF